MGVFVKSSLLSFTAYSAILSVAAPAAAQGQESLQGGDIVVTANRTESLASKTPVALTAITGDGLREAGVTNPTELKDYVPNLSIDRTNGGVQITIRGVTSADTTEKGDPSAAFMLDGIYIARPQAQETSFFDIARVEVLRGPQGTLYGRNTTAGVVNVITNRPTFSFGGSADVQYGNYDALTTSGTVNVPLSDSVAVRASVNYDRRDNYVDAGPAVTGRIDPFKNNISGRLQGLYKWASGDLLLRGDYSRIRGVTYDTLPLRSFYAATTTGVDPVYVGGNGKRYRYVNAPINFDNFRRNKTWGVSAELTQELGPVTATYIGSYRKLQRDELEARISPDGRDVYKQGFEGGYWQNSQELRFATNGNGPLKLQAGAYYFKEKSHTDLRVLQVPNPGPTGDGRTAGFLSDPTISESYAFFGQGTYSLTDRLRVTGGVRYSHDDKSRVGLARTCIDYACTSQTQTPNNASVSFSKVTWKGGIDFDANSTTLIYAVASSGYKAGGFNDGCLTGTAAGCTRTENTLYYEPETLTAFEGGVKTRLLNNALRLNLAAFHYKYSNMQLTQIVAECTGPGTATCALTTNAARSSVSGLEIEATARPSPNDQFDFSMSYLDAHYTDYPLNPTTNFAGKPLDRSPDWTVSAGYNHTFPLGNGGEIVAGAHTKLSDSYTIVLLGSANFYRQPSFTRTDATLTYNAPERAWYLQGFIKNIEDANVVTSIAVGTRSVVQIADPRTYGVRAGIKF
ncbi:TonB-dependent receptor [Novosphingobium sp. 11B]